MTAHLRHHPDELTETQRDRMCPSCRIRYHVTTIAPSELYGPLHISPTAYQWLVNAAKVWDAESSELYSAADFIAWIRFDVAAYRSFVYPTHDGGGTRLESGGFGRNYAHRHPDPIPFVELPRTWER